MSERKKLCSIQNIFNKCNIIKRIVNCTVIPFIVTFLVFVFIFRISVVSCSWQSVFHIVACVCLSSFSSEAVFMFRWYFRWPRILLLMVFANVTRRVRNLLTRIFRPSTIEDTCSRFPACDDPASHFLVTPVWLVSSIVTPKQNQGTLCHPGPGFQRFGNSLFKETLLFPPVLFGLLKMQRLFIYFIEFAWYLVVRCLMEAWAHGIGMLMASLPECYASLSLSLFAFFHGTLQRLKRESPFISSRCTITFSPAIPSFSRHAHAGSRRRLSLEGLISGLKTLTTPLFCRTAMLCFYLFTVQRGVKDPVLLF